MKSEYSYWIALNSLNISPRIIANLVEKFGTPQKIFNATRAELKETEGITANALKVIREFDQYDWAEKELETADNAGISILPLGSESYPKMLSEIYDPPTILYVKGALSATDQLSLAIVGSRKATAHGLRATNEISASLIEYGITLVSGMARGIDTEVHRTAIKSGGRTIAVLGSGLEFIYPPENRGLYNDISKHGAVVSEFPLLTPPNPYNFPRRNRIISGLSLGTLVVEAAEKSGSLITAGCALEQGREVFAIPGAPDWEKSGGSNKLIQDGAKLVRSVEDILAELPVRLKKIPTTADKKNRERLSDIQLWILSAIEAKPLNIDNMAEQSTYSTRSLGSALSSLELRGLVRRTDGNRYIKEF